MSRKGRVLAALAHIAQVDQDGVEFFRQPRQSFFLYVPLRSVLNEYAKAIVHTIVDGGPIGCASGGGGPVGR